MKAIIYTRVSTTTQAAEGVSLDAQQAKARSWAEANSYEVAAVYSDAGISGKKAANRPGLQQALDEVCSARGNVLVVYSLSRLARSTKDCITIADRLEKAGADLVSLTERIDTTSAAGKMVFRMLAVLAEFERDLVSERTKAALAHKAAKGERVGQIPFGRTLAANGVDLVENAEELAIVADFQTMRAEGMSWQEIADAMNARGVKTKTGRAWTWQTVRNTAAAA
jgi:DNA invertase Pin-like site-specific DNA recombinase